MIFLLFSMTLLMLYYVNRLESVLDIIDDAFRQARSGQSFEPVPSQSSDQASSRNEYQVSSPNEVMTSGYAVVVDGSDSDESVGGNEDMVTVEVGESDAERSTPSARQASQSND